MDKTTSMVFSESDVFFICKFDLIYCAGGRYFFKWRQSDKMQLRYGSHVVFSIDDSNQFDQGNFAYGKLGIENDSHLVSDFNLLVEIEIIFIMGRIFDRKSHDYIDNRLFQQYKRKSQTNGARFLRMII